MEKLFIIDAHNFIFRAYYAIGPMTNPKGESTNALYGFIRSVYKIIKDFSPENLVIVFDGPDNKQSRREVYADYKSHRTGMPEDLIPQMHRAVEFCEIAGLANLCISGVEADDTMGSIAKWAEKKGLEVVICSSDKDLCQLVSDSVFVINPHKDNLFIDKHKVKEIFGVTPEQIVDYLAIMGDASDNIPGLEGFGPKTAVSLLNEFHTLENILEHPEKITSPKKQETIRNGKEIALLSKKLATIHTEVPFPKEESFFQFRMPELEKVKAFFHEMNFMSLLKEMGAAQESPSPKARQEDGGEGVYHLIDDETSLNFLIEKLQNEKELCVDTETSDIRPMFARLVGIGFCIHPKEAWYIPANGKLGKEKVISAIKPLLENEKIAFCGHNIKYDMHVLLNEGIALKNIGFDTIIASYLLSPQNQRHNLDQLTIEKFGKVKIPIEDLIGKGKKQISMLEVPIEKVCTYCCEDADYTCRLKQSFKKALTDANLNPIFYDIELPLVPILLKMERHGIYLNIDKTKKMSHELAHEIKSLEQEIYKLAGETFNVNSPKQLSVILFEKMGLKPPKKTTTGFSTSADVLESLQDDALIVKEILAYRTLEKLRSTYVDALPTQILPSTKRIHCTFNQSVAATGRLSCQDPNLQNIPVRTSEGRKIREAFEAEKTHWCYLAADYSQIELRLLAHLSEDPALLKAFKEGEDIHAYTASLVFNVPLKEVTQQMRYQAKTVNFGILYGQGAFGLSQLLSIDYKEAASFIETYFQRYHKVKEFLNFCKEGVRTTGKAVTMTGRQRPIPEIHSKNPAIRAAAERLAINTPLQGTAADLIKLAMIQIDRLFSERQEEGYMILQIHDELLFEIPDAHVSSLKDLIKSTMENVMPLKVPLVVDISIGKNWGEC